MLRRVALVRRHSVPSQRPSVASSPILVTLMMGDVNDELLLLLLLMVKALRYKLEGRGFEI
jgi:hypothetical protein